MSQHTDPPIGTETRIDQLISLDAQDVNGCCVVTVAGEVDMVTTPYLRSYLHEQVARVVSTLVVDLREVGFLGSSGLAVLVEALDWARDQGVTLRLVCDSREVVRPLEATGLNELFEIHSDPTTAVTPPRP